MWCSNAADRNHVLVIQHQQFIGHLESLSKCCNSSSCGDAFTLSCSASLRCIDPHRNKNGYLSVTRLNSADPKSCTFKTWRAGRSRRSSIKPATRWTLLTYRSVAVFCVFCSTHHDASELVWNEPLARRHFDLLLSDLWWHLERAARQTDGGCTYANL